jgi:UDP-N-acetylmuramyl pentapeptide phosphotransferase/UDP-N-acetylglucosamine-1-phosphate transferase
VRWRILDHPNERSSHVGPTPRGGGISILLVIAVASLWLGRSHGGHITWMVPLVALGVGLVSLVDDVRGLSARVRFGAHILGAIALLWGAGLLDSRGEAGNLASTLHVSPRLLQGCMVFWIVGYTNSFNFMDGINGIAAVQAGVGALAMAAVAGVGVGNWESAPVLLSVVVSAAAFGFLPHNFPRARMFMGDVGSAPLGMLLAFLALWICREHGFRLFIPLAMIHANFILDTGITLCRRVVRGDRWLEPHREQFYQRLVRAGQSHTLVTGCEGVLLVVGSVAAVMMAGAGWRGQLVAAGFVVAMWGSFFVYAESIFRRSKEPGAASRRIP